MFFKVNVVFFFYILSRGGGNLPLAADIFFLIWRCIYLMMDLGQHALHYNEDYHFMKLKNSLNLR